MSRALDRPATQEGLRRHNRRAVLRALYRGEARSRSELALVTGLTKPTVSTLVAELIAEGLVSEQGLGQSSGSGGKRPTLLRFETGARQVVGVSVGEGRALGVLSDLAGEVSAMHVSDLGDDPTAAVLEVVAGLRAQLDAPLASVGVGLPGAQDGESLRGLEARVGVPVHVAGRAELGALGQLAFGGGSEGTLVSLVVDDGVEVGVCLAGGAVHYGSDLSALAPRLDWRAVEDDLRAVLRDVSVTGAGGASGPPGDASAQVGSASLRPGSLCLALRAAAARGDPAAESARDGLAERLSQVLAWVVAALRPDQVALGGPLAELGEPFLELLKSRLAARLPAWQLADLHLTLVYTQQVSAMGAVALAVQRELELLFG